jgi:hypothetical protein
VLDEDIEANLNLTSMDEDDEDPNGYNGTNIDNLPTASPGNGLLDAVHACC